LELSPGTTNVVLQCLDNSVYFGEENIGTRNLPTKDKDGKHHITGKLVMADKRDITELVWTLMPLLNVVSGLQKVFITPLPRYDNTKCCKNNAHITNFSEPEYQPMMMERTCEYRKWSRETLHKLKVAGIKTVQAEDLLRRPEQGDGISGPLRGPDAVHLSGAGYANMAAELVKILEWQQAAPGAAPKTARRHSADAAAIRHDKPAGKRFAGHKRD